MIISRRDSFRVNLAMLGENLEKSIVNWAGHVVELLNCSFVHIFRENTVAQSTAAEAATEAKEKWKPSKDEGIEVLSAEEPNL